MIAEKAQEAIELAVKFEHNQITTKYGDTYNSDHEAYAVLLEEVEEATDFIDSINKNLAYIWALIKNNHIRRGHEVIAETQKYATELAKEAVQCAAVCERFIETIEREEN